MSNRTNLVYFYDGTFDGLLCCVFESFTCKETPTEIFPFDTSQTFLYKSKDIITISENAERVNASLTTKMCADAKYLIETAFLYCDDTKAIVIYRFICLGYKHGKNVVDMLGNDTVSALQNMARAVSNERHLMLGFLRFSEYGGGLVAVIEPKHFILPTMQSHFCQRFRNEQFLIYDKTNGMVLIYANHKAQIIAVDNFELPPVDETELQYRRLWAQYYNTIGIEERENSKCRMGHMPKRFWKHLTEMTIPTGKEIATKKVEEIKNA